MSLDKIENRLELIDNPELYLTEEDPVLVEWKSYYPLINFLRPKETYTLFKNRIRITSGRMTQYTRDVEFKRIDHMAIRTSFFGRIFNSGDVILATKEDIILHVKNPEEVLDLLNQARYNEKQAFLHSRGAGKNAYSHKKENRKNNKNNTDSNTKAQRAKKDDAPDWDKYRNVAP